MTTKNERAVMETVDVEPTAPISETESDQHTYLTDLYGLTGRVALVTGGATGIGLALAKALAAAGASVAICGRGRHGDLDTAAGEVAAAAGPVGTDDRVDTAAVTCDVTDEAAVRETVDGVVDRFGSLDILIANAGVTWGAASEELPLDRWEAVLTTNLTGAFLCMREAGRVMIEQQRGSIIAISSVAALIGGEVGIAGYAASKAGLLGLVRQLAVEWATDGVRVNAIAPGWFPTHMSRHFTGEDSPLRSVLLSRIPMRRFGKLDELAGAAVFLASDASSYMTGQSIVIDGGMVVQ